MFTHRGRRSAGGAGGHYGRRYHTAQGEMTLDLGPSTLGADDRVQRPGSGPVLRAKVGLPLTVDVWNDTNEEDSYSVVASCPQRTAEISCTVAENSPASLYMVLIVRPAAAVSLRESKRHYLNARIGQDAECFSHAAGSRVGAPSGGRPGKRGRPRSAHRHLEGTTRSCRKPRAMPAEPR